MGEAPGGLLGAELDLARLEVAIAAELPAHLRAFARAHAAGRPAPAAPAIVTHPASLVRARRALAHPELVDAALRALRLIVPVAIEAAPEVAAAAHRPPSWPALAALAAARDAAARRLVGAPALAVHHALAGVPAAPARSPGPLPPAPTGWREVDRPVDRPLGPPAVAAAWRALAAQHGATGTVVIEHAAARPRAFVTSPQRAVNVIVPPVLDTPAARFAVLHELGHALINVVAPAGLPRALDEAVAAYVARLLEDEDGGAALLGPGWTTPVAAAARAHRTAIAHTLDAAERAQPGPAPGGPLAGGGVPWALWHDPGAQAAYAHAEVLADAWWEALGPRPPAGALAALVASERARIDAATRL